MLYPTRSPSCTSLGLAAKQISRAPPLSSCLVSRGLLLLLVGPDLPTVILHRTADDATAHLLLHPVEPVVAHEQGEQQDGDAQAHGDGEQGSHGLLIGASDGGALAGADVVAEGDEDVRVDGGGVGL